MREFTDTSPNLLQPAPDGGSRSACAGYVTVPAWLQSLRPVRRVVELGSCVIARAMKNQRIIISGVLATLVVAFIVSIIPNLRHRTEWERTVTALKSLPHDRLGTAVQSFKRDRKPTDSTVPLRELVSGGYLRAADIRGLEERDVTVSLSADETSPQMVLISVRASDDSEIALLADGSIQKMARQR